MDDKIHNTVERILQFIEYKKISKRKFAASIGISHSLIGKANAIGSDKLEKIISKYPELNINWLLTGKGNMLTDAIDMQGGIEYDMHDDTEYQKRHSEILEKNWDVWKNENYILENDKKILAENFLFTTYYQKNIQFLYQLPIKKLSDKIATLKKEYQDYYLDYYTLLSAINNFKLGHYSSKFEIPPTFNTALEKIEKNVEDLYGGIKDKKLKSIFYIKEYEEEIESIKWQIHLTIIRFNDASKFLSHL